MFSNGVEDVKKELQGLCVEYITILEKLKNNGFIDQEFFEEFTLNKTLFLEEK